MSLDVGMQGEVNTAPPTLASSGAHLPDLGNVDLPASICPHKVGAYVLFARHSTCSTLLTRAFLDNVDILRCLGGGRDLR